MSDARRPDRETSDPASLPVGFAGRIVAWQKEHGRHDLPWQRTRDPYRVWLSEVMLQQTQVKAVLGHYVRFVERFPDVRSLAAAAPGDVLAAWSGLGYYGRARNLHRSAQRVVAEHGGEFPRTSAALAQLPGIGRSTAAAIAAFCFGERAAILDGNVRRVLARILAFDRDLADPRSERALWNVATALLPADDIEAYTQGLMDVGATLCRVRAPHCLLCPAQPLCVAARAGTHERYPVKSRRAVRGRRDNVWLELCRRGDVFLVERDASGVWAGLWSLPELDSLAELDALAAAWPGSRELLPPFVHVLTHFDWHLQPVRWTLPTRTSPSALESVLARWPRGRWFAPDDALALGLPAPLRKRLHTIAAVDA
ncbi:MAG TPA: A/G-specific adenine glycosylase [Caldimonas sp.]|nr:A/G-specific adenine glycosylase [Caldimonas sp.]HEX4235876.1 A/G-specific adenine glycosylase [Caldimonas sp.]